MKNRYEKERLGSRGAFPQLKQGFRSLKETIKSDFKEIRAHFTLRAFFCLFFGALLLGACHYLFFAPTIYAFRYLSLYTTLAQFFPALIGFLFSNVLIVLLSVHSAASYPLGEVQTGGDGVETALSEALNTKGKERAKKIAAAILVYVLIFAAGFTALGFYIRDEVRYRVYAETVAVIELVNSYGDGYTLRYGYDVNGEHYEYLGNGKYSGSAAPKAGDTVKIKYDPADPEKVYLQNESPALVFAVFLLGAGLIIVFSELYKRKKLPIQFLLSACMLVIPAVTFVALGMFQPSGGIIEFFARTLVLQIVLVFVYAGVLELINGFLLLGTRR